MVVKMTGKVLPDRKETELCFVESVKFCPNCNVTITGTYFDAYRYNDARSGLNIIYATHFCENCEQVFSVRYLRWSEREPFHVDRVFPAPTKVKDFEPYIHEVSPRFVKIYNQSAQAESGSLDEIAGMGYRKALECLVKDYLIGVKNIKRETIENMPLAQCINQYVKNEILSMLMTKSTWLGNDFAHYVCKHDEGIDTLKKMLDAAVYWICMEKIAADADQIERK